MKLFSILSASAIATALISPVSAIAQTQAVAKTPCEVEGDLWRGDLSARIADKKGRAKPEVNLWYGHSYAGAPSTVEELESWIARNPGNICTPDAKKALAFRKMQRDQMAQLNAEAAQARANKLAALRASPTTGASEPKFSRPPAISSDDIPRRSEGGTVGYELGVDEVGAVVSCRVVASANAALDQATCALLRRRARFEPARDEKGMPVASTYRNKITWPAAEF